MTKAIEIGTRVIESEGTAANVDYVKRELGEGLDELDRRLGGTLEEGAEALTERIAATFGAERNDSVQAQIKEIVTGEARQQREQLFSSLTAEDTSNPLNAMQVRIGQKILETEERHRAEVEKLRESHATQSRAMQTQVHELKEHLARLLDKDEHELELAEAEAAGTRKGISFEERVHDGDRGDRRRPRRRRHAYRRRAGRGRGQEGRHPGRDRRLRRLLAGADRVRGQGQAAEQERGLGRAQRGDGGEGGVVRGARRRRRGEPPVRARGADRVRGQQADRRGRSRRARAGSGSRSPTGSPRRGWRWRATATCEVDAIAVRDTAAEAISLLKQAQAIRSALTGIKTSSDKARAGLDSMVAALEERLERIDALVAEEAAEAEAGL